MRNHRWLLYLLTILGFVALPLHAEKVAQLPKPTGYIDDYANVLSPNAKSDMEAICVELHNKTKAQIFVVTINTLDGESIEPYSNDLFHTWTIGEKKTDRGALILLAAHDHKYRIEVGYGLEGILNDAKVGDIGRAMVSRPSSQRLRFGSPHQPECGCKGRRRRFAGHSGHPQPCLRNYTASSTYTSARLQQQSLMGILYPVWLRLGRHLRPGLRTQVHRA